jgi:hypothetical protein
MEEPVRWMQVLVGHLYLCASLSAVDCHSYASVSQELQEVVTFVVDSQVRACVVVDWDRAILVCLLPVGIAVL